MGHVLRNDKLLRERSIKYWREGWKLESGGREKEMH